MDGTQRLVPGILLVSVQSKALIFNVFINIKKNHYIHLNNYFCFNYYNNFCNFDNH